MKPDRDVLLLTRAEQLAYNRFGARLRYFGIAFALGLSALARFTDFYPEFPAHGVALLAIFVAAYNAGGDLILRHYAAAGTPRRALMRLQGVLTILDQATVTATLYLMGGLEAFVMSVMLLSTFMAAINTGKRQAYFFMATQLGFVGAFFLLQHFGVIGFSSAVPESWTGLPAPAANSITARWPSMAAAWLVLAGLLFGVVYFSNFVKDKYGRVLEEILADRQEITSLRRLSADILDIFPFAVIIVRGDDGIVEAANPAAAELLGVHPGWLGRRVRDIADLVEMGLTPYFERGLAGDEFQVRDFPLVRPALGRKAFLSISVQTARKPDGAPDKVLFCLEDITDRRRHEEEQRELQQVLLQTEKMASLGQMAAGVAHELNNPLTAIDAYAQYLEYRLKRGEPLGEESLVRIGRILENSERIRILVKNLLSYARPAPETSMPLHLHTVIDEALLLVEHDMRKLDIEVVKDYAALLPRVIGNKTQLQQMFINLFLNAAHAMEPAKGRLVVATRAEDDFVIIEVADNGSGIERAHLDRIFEPFYTTKAPGEGTGLGLSIVLSIVEKHAGSIAVSSKPDDGTCFTARLPAEPPSC